MAHWACSGPRIGLSHELIHQTHAPSPHTPETEIVSAGPATVYVVVSNEDGSKRSAARVQKADDTQWMWATGEGLVEPPPADG